MCSLDFNLLSEAIFYAIRKTPILTVNSFDNFNLLSEAIFYAIYGYETFEDYDLIFQSSF